MSRIEGRADVVVVGAGFAGAATALGLARAGLRVVVLEREAALGHHASGRNAALARQLDDDDAITRLCMRGTALLREPPAGLAGRFLRPTGSLLVAGTAARLDALVAAARRTDLAHRVVGIDEVVARWPRLADLPAVGALAVPGDGVIEVRALLAALVDGVRAAGGVVELGAGVERIERRGAREVVVACARGEVAARAVVIASGAWAGEVGARAGSSAPPLAIERRHLFVTEADPAIDRDAPLVWYEDDAEFYARPDGDGYLVSGCDRSPAVPCDAEVDPAVEVALAARLAERAPGLAALPIAARRACLRSFAPGRRPRIAWDADAPHLFWVAGLGGHGATSALAIAELATAGVLAKL